MTHLFKSIPARILLRLSNAVYDHRRWFFYPQAILFLVCILYTVKSLEFWTDRSALVGAEKEYHRLFQELKKEFPAGDDMVVVVESEQSEKNRQFIERLGAKLDAETNLFTGVFYKGDLKAMGPKALLFLKEDGLKGLHETLEEYVPMMQRFARATNLVSLFDLINTQFRTAKREASAENESLVKALPALERIVSLATDGLQRAGSPPSPGVTALFEGGAESERAQYLAFGDGRIYLATAQAKKSSLVEQAVLRLREMLEETKTEVPGLNVGLTGEPILEYDEMSQSQKDSTFATVVSLVMVALIFVYGYHETGRPLKATACLLVGLAYTMGFTTFAVGHLNILTITFVPMLIGLAIDFGVHLITRYEEELRHGRSERVALQIAMVNTGQGIFTGALTTAAAFFAMGFTDFDGIREMGIICGGGMLLCLVPMLTLLPVLLLRGYQNVLDHELGPVLETQTAEEVAARARIERLWLDRPLAVIAIVFLITGVSIYFGLRVRFDYNLLHMQSAGLPAVVFQDKLIHSSKRSVLFAAMTATSAEEAVRLSDVLTNLSTVETVESMGPFLSGDQSAKLAVLGQIKQVAAQVHFHPVDPTPADVPELMRSLFSLHGYLGLAVTEVRKEESPLFTTNSFPKPEALCGRLQTDSDPVSRFLWERLRPASREVLKITNMPSARLRVLLTEALNPLVESSGPIYDPTRFARIPFPSETTKQLALGPTGLDLMRLNRRLIEDAYPGEVTRTLDRQLESLRHAIAALLERLRTDERDWCTEKLTRYQRALFQDVRQTFEAIRDQDNREHLRPEDLPQSLRNRFVGVTGKQLLMIYPKKDVWDRKNQEEFIEQLRQVDRKVTGSPVQLLEYTTLLKESYQEAAVYSLIAITIMVFIHFRKVSSVVLSLIPVVIGTLWMLGVMGISDIPFNPANIMTLPLIVGIGVTNGIHILNRFAEERHPSILARSTGKAVIVSGLTTIAGFGSLLLAEHRGIRSLGMIMSVGTATCMIAALTLLPAILNLRHRKGESAE